MRSISICGIALAFALCVSGAAQAHEDQLPPDTTTAILPGGHVGYDFDGDGFLENIDFWPEESFWPEPPYRPWFPDDLYLNPGYNPIG